MGLLNDFFPGGVEVSSQSEMSRKNTPSVKIDLADDEQSVTFSEEYIEDCDSDTDEGRLSRALQSWMTDYEITTIIPKNKPSEQPIYSGRVGKEFVLKRSESEESLLTGISLFSCSEWGIPNSASTGDDSSIKKRRRRRMKSPGRSSSSRTESPKPRVNWEEIVKRTKATSSFDTYMNRMNLRTVDFYNDDEFESEAFLLMDPDEQEGLRKCGLTTGIKLNKKLQKSGSMTNINEGFNVRKIGKRCLSAGSKSIGKPINLEQCKQQYLMAKRLLAMQQQQQQSRGWSKLKRTSRISVTSATSDTSSEVPLDTKTERNLNKNRPDNEPEEEEIFTVWKGDREILEIDLKKGLTKKVMSKIQTTTTALSRVTGHGETNEFHKCVGRHDEFPKLVEEDYGVLPKIVQRIRISPHLSNVIKDDIKVRMGRPRYHEICQQDLAMWNRGHSLNRSHRNLKVFNWLHSLRESEFSDYQNIVIDDSVNVNVDEIEILHVESADDPDAKPLYMKDFKFNRKIMKNRSAKKSKPQVEKYTNNVSKSVRLKSGT